LSNLNAEKEKPKPVLKVETPKGGRSKLPPEWPTVLFMRGPFAVGRAYPNDCFSLAREKGKSSLLDNVRGKGWGRRWGANLAGNPAMRNQ